jgi:DNA-binding NarL/FixJ family response regulator
VDITTVPQDLTDVAILELISIGFRDQDIAEALHYSVQAIKNRIGIMLKRSGSNNRTQLAVQYTDKLLTAQIIEALERPKNPAQKASKM